MTTPSVLLVTPVTDRRAEVSASASHRVCPSALTARPEVCANHASPTGPSTSPSLLVPAQSESAGVTGSNRWSWWVPAIATTTSCSAGNHTTSHGVESGTAGSESRGTGSPCIHCAPVPATVRTSPVARVSPRRTWLTLSATTTS